MLSTNGTRFIKLYKKLSQDPNFEDEFMGFFEDSVVDYQSKIISATELDEKVWEWIVNWISTKRENKLDNLLG